ncbi:hypothetical protein TEQG_01417 [Trichophyton equinum CBS 127.97]|uniref:Uncharacterized protein n=1 Tax=Trichophyton equinum (strain ATCC MYA-4606 / CBS 127.97) TaxID=559882 RepID=F2PKG2_TRIEC|nr:hypothetical protein TEQG_01417 [Trichophyton equinum CBS 127.97]
MFSKKAPAPPPPPPPPAGKKAPTLPPAPKPPVVASKGPAGAFLVQLLVYNGSPFKDHWAFWVCSHTHPDLGVLIHATGDVKNGFKFEVKRGHDFRVTGNIPMKRIALQWVDAQYFDEKGYVQQWKIQNRQRTLKAPGKTLNAANDMAASGKKIIQRNCQTWIVESADQLVKDYIFSRDVAIYLHTIKQ